MNILLLSDGRPGHYHLAEGVVSAVQRICSATCSRFEIKRKKIIPGRLLRKTVNYKLIAPDKLFWLGSGMDAGNLPQADLVVSAGGDTLVANIAAAGILNVPNIFCGSLRDIQPENLDMVITSYRRFARLPRHVLSLKPTSIDPDVMARPEVIPLFSEENPPKTAALLIGGNSGFFSYEREEWGRLFEFIHAISEQWGTKWFVTTSRRTDDWVGDEIAKLAADGNAIKEFVDYRTAGPGTLPGILAQSDVVVCTEDSSTMISEAISARFPVVGVSPAHHGFKPEEAEYRQFLLSENWCRFLPIAELDVGLFGKALGEIKPLSYNHLDRLAGILKERLPNLFGESMMLSQ